ncbi:hypothetical protein CDAR_444451 [Caerostris darwini]|uniref:Uncharacterized protein n=1 Tax=Caerostris darwini TaxID=1538125 RepID=A0AAV4UPD7_9ARAC|nr:hypothetical protein CDAR_444451 [Caerostris darwini]
MVSTPPPVVMDEFLCNHITDIVKIIEFESKLIADWFRLLECNSDPSLALQYDQAYNASKNEMDVLCVKLGISHNEVPLSITDLKNHIEYFHVAKHTNATPAPKNQHQQSATISRKGSEKRYLDADGFRVPPKHLIRRTTASTTDSSTTLPSGNRNNLSTNLSNNIDTTEQAPSSSTN